MRELIEGYLTKTLGKEVFESVSYGSGTIRPHGSYNLMVYSDGFRLNFGSHNLKDNLAMGLFLIDLKDYMYDNGVSITVKDAELGGSNFVMTATW